MIPKKGRAGVDVSLFVQVLALMAGALVVAQAINIWILYYGYPPQPELHSASQIADAALVRPPPEGEKGLRASTVPESPLPPPTNLNPPGPNSVRSKVAERMTAAGFPVDPSEMRFKDNRTAWFRNARPGQRNQPIFANNNSGDPSLIAPFVIAIHQPDGNWRVVQTPPGVRLDPWQQRTLITFAVTFLVALVAAYLFTRRLTAPFTRLAESADRLGRDPGASPLAVSGPREARSAAQAFNVMQERLRRYVEDRTAMVGAIAHDLRTPLTRLRFRIESLPDGQKAKMSADLDQMEAMVAATLSFVRDATQPAQRTKLELSSVLESLVDEMTDMGSQVAMERSDKVVVEGDPVALKRLFGNLLDNAVKYGKVARVRVFRSDDHAIVEVDDDGPGVPEKELERLFEPFYRREPSRNRDTGGIGLGLAVVRTVARAHGGDAELINREGGGLTARVSLPV